MRTLTCTMHDSARPWPHIITCYPTTESVRRGISDLTDQINTSLIWQNSTSTCQWTHHHHPPLSPQTHYLTGLFATRSLLITARWLSTRKGPTRLRKNYERPPRSRRGLSLQMRHAPPWSFPALMQTICRPFKLWLARLFPLYLIEPTFSSGCEMMGSQARLRHLSKLSTQLQEEFKVKYNWTNYYVINVERLGSIVHIALL